MSKVEIESASGLVAGNPSDASAESTIAHMEEEFAQLEGRGRPHWVRALMVLVLIGAGAAGVWYWLETKSVARATPVAVVGVPIDIRQPRTGSAFEMPPMFVWESVVGRSDYTFTLKRDDAVAPVVERTLMASNLNLTKDELAKLSKGSYVWIVRARSQDGAVIGTGSGRFELR